MATTAADAVFVDTNVLLSATAPARRLHRPALSLLDRWPSRGVRLATSGQVFREYLCVATRPAGANGLALSPADAFANVVALAERLRLLDEDRRVFSLLGELLQATPCRGKQVHDANLVATMLRHGVLVLVTEDPGDFSRFATRIQVRGLDAG